MRDRIITAAFSLVLGVIAAQFATELVLEVFFGTPPQEMSIFQGIYAAVIVCAGGIWAHAFLSAVSRRD